MTTYSYGLGRLFSCEVFMAAFTRQSSKARYLLSEDDDHAIKVPIGDWKRILSLALCKTLVYGLDKSLNNCFGTLGSTCPASLTVVALP